MPPKRKTRAAAVADATANPAPVSASQPQPEIHRPTRSSGRKRRHSDGSNVSDGKSQLDVKKTPAKKGPPRKNPPADAEAILEEDEKEVQDVLDEVMDESESEKPGPACSQRTELEDHPLPTMAVNEEYMSQVAQSSTKHVHFPVSDAPKDDSTVSSIAYEPGPKMAVKRRRTASLTEEETTVKRFKDSRTSLPASLSQEEPTQVIQDLRFAPLRSVLSRHINRLSQADTDFDDEDMKLVDSDMLVLDGTDEIRIPQLPSPPRTHLSRQDGLDSKGEAKDPLTPGAYDRGLWNSERKKLQQAIFNLRAEADNAKTQLQVLHLELESLEFAEEGESSLAILQSIREAFAHVREFLEVELPDSLPEGASNGDLTEILVSNVSEFASRLRVADKELNEKSQLVGELSGQVNGLIDRLARKQISSTELLDRLSQLEEANNDKDRDLAALQEHVRTTDTQLSLSEKERAVETARADAFEEEKEQLEKSLQRLSESLQQYRDEEARLTDKINNLEDEHRATVTAMNKERELTVRELETRLDKSIVEFGEATKTAEERNSLISELEGEIWVSEQEKNRLKEELDDLTADRDAQRAAREEADGQLVAANDEIDDLEARVARLEEELDRHQTEVETLRQLSETERRQRGAAEADLDDHNLTITDLESKLREQGKQANELRQKLFEVQTSTNSQIQSLEAAASERDEQFQENIAAEAARREEVEDLAKQRAAQILELEQNLEEIEGKMRDVVKERNLEVARLEDQIQQRDAEIQNLSEDLQNNEVSYEKRIEETRTKVAELENRVGDLQGTILDHEGVITGLRQQALNAAEDRTSRIQERDAKIAILQDEIAGLEVAKQDLEIECSRLEHKVEHEAENMLLLQNDCGFEIENLKQTIRDQYVRNRDIEIKAREADRQWEALSAAKEEQISNLTSTTERQSDIITDLGLRFGEYVRRSSTFIANLREQIDATKEFVDEDGDALVDDGERLIEEFGAVRKEKTVRKVKGMGKKRRQEDSGVGLSLGLCEGEENETIAL